jgi:glyoxylase-like metal-dependent hydrolase (beta-lactamase superfamily II)
MDIKIKPMGDYQTNCYIVTVDNKDFIIDPGVNATSWVKQNVKNPVAILNTHGHFDHVWSNTDLQKELNVKIYCPTPGCSAIEINNTLFSGDFIFNGSIGRTDFPYSNPDDMKSSLRKVLSWEKEIVIYPGHGLNTKLSQEKNSLNNWLNYL